MCSATIPPARSGRKQIFQRVERILYVDKGSGLGCKLPVSPLISPILVPYIIPINSLCNPELKVFVLGSNLKFHGGAVFFLLVGIQETCAWVVNRCAGTLNAV